MWASVSQNFFHLFMIMESIILNSVQPNRYHNTLKLNSFDDDVLQPYTMDSVLQFDFSDPSKFANAWIQPSCFLKSLIWSYFSSVLFILFSLKFLSFYQGSGTVILKRLVKKCALFEDTMVELNEDIRNEIKFDAQNCAVSYCKDIYD